MNLQKMCIQDSNSTCPYTVKPSRTHSIGESTAISLYKGMNTQEPSGGILGFQNEGEEKELLAAEKDRTTKWEEGEDSYL